MSTFQTRKDSRKLANSPSDHFDREAIPIYNAGRKH